MTIELATCSYKEFKPEMGFPVRASLGAPRWKIAYELVPGTNCWEITPRRDYLRASDAEYTRRYNAQLEGYGVEKITERFEEIHKVAGYGPLVLLCFEDLRAKGMNSCHRRDFANWWLNRTGQEIPELGAVPDKKTEGDGAAALDRGGLW